METNNIKKWEPIDSIPERLYLEGLYDDYEGFRLLLRGREHNSKMMRIMFKSYLGYRNIDESYMLKTINENLVLCERWSLFFSHNTDFVRWIIDESYGIYKDIINYIICTPNDIVEVIATETPIVEWL